MRYLLSTFANMVTVYLEENEVHQKFAFQLDIAIQYIPKKLIAIQEENGS